ncbi:hypothetical protein D3C87_387910 [compost metagenome]|jgi:hypothetical protein|uniref:hypothetical protein n=1 Tax=Achromobacter sp. Root83 TaxID=1736602 RepID=UPI00070F3CA6|nr:hypothetical protein [Achromobacter sp. Root83]KRC79213.1 hypothetical protein ASE30_24860 [Achromobacter sp. Root83]
MTLHRPGVFAAAVFVVISLSTSNADAACSEKKIVAMAKEGRSIKSIAKSCNMPAAKVREAAGDAGAEPSKPQAATQNPPQSSPQTPSQTPPQAPAQTPAKGKPKAVAPPEPEPAPGLPSGAGLASCDCKGSVPYGKRAPELRCQSGMSIATPCPGYCSPHGIAPWRRICS